MGMETLEIVPKVICKSLNFASSKFYLVLPNSASVFNNCVSSF